MNKKCIDQVDSKHNKKINKKFKEDEMKNSFHYHKRNTSTSLEILDMKSEFSEGKLMDLDEEVETYFRFINGK